MALFELFEMLVVQSGESLKFEIGGGAPVEAFLGELVLIAVGNAHCDVVVVFEGFDAAPEEQLFKVVGSH